MATGNEQQRSAADLSGQSQGCFSGRVLRRPCGRRIFEGRPSKRNQVRSILNSNQFTMIRRKDFLSRVLHFHSRTLAPQLLSESSLWVFHPKQSAAGLGVRSVYQKRGACLRVFFAKLRNMIPTF